MSVTIQDIINSKKDIMFSNTYTKRNRELHIGEKYGDLSTDACVAHDPRILSSAMEAFTEELDQKIAHYDAINEEIEDSLVFPQALINASKLRSNKVF